MANGTIANPNLLTDPGVIYWAPLGSSLPTGVSTASAFSDTWPVAWVPLGMTESGTSIDITMTTSPITAAEVIEPLEYRTTDRTGSATFMLKGFTAANLVKAFNGAITTVTGTGASTITQIDPPVVGMETRGMFGWESLDSTSRFVAFQTFNSGDIKLDFQKVPKTATIPFKLMFEKPPTTQSWRMWTAGTARA